MLRTDLVTGAGLFEALRGPWRELAAEAPGATPFQTFEWQSTWWKHFGGAKVPMALVAYEGKDLVGLMPLVRTRGPWRAARPMGVGPSDYLHPIAREGQEERFAAAMLNRLTEERSVDLIDLHQVRETKPLAQAAGESIEQATCLVLDLPDTYDDYLATLGKSLRYDVRKLDKSMFQEGKATIQTYGPEDAQEGLAIFYELHNRRWKERGQWWGGAFVGRTVPFHREWVEMAARQGWLRLSVLRLEGVPIGAIYGMAMGPTTFFYQSGFSPEHKSVSPGTLLVAHTIRTAIEEGRRHFDFMRGDEPYKRRWKPQHVLKNLRFLVPAGGLLGRMGTKWNHTGFRIESRVRERLEGKGLS